MNHPTPWKYNETGYITDATGSIVLVNKSADDGVLPRIVACVNACKGISTEDLNTIARGGGFDYWMSVSQAVLMIGTPTEEVKAGPADCNMVREVVDCECCQAVVPRDAAISFDGGETWTPVELRL